MLSKASVLVTGGTGFLGSELVRLILDQYPDIKRLIVFSRDELKQYNMSLALSTKDFPALKYVLGDIRDRERLQQACVGVDYLIHAAALKQVPTGERNPTEYVKTNILGTENVVQIAKESKVGKVVTISTDKAVSPSGVYGATKLCSERLTIANDEDTNCQATRLAVVRVGNILGSYGSVLPFFQMIRKEKVLHITDERMTRFSITAQEAAKAVLWVLNYMKGGEIFVPKSPSYRLVQLAEAAAPSGYSKRFVGIRSGEKIHEELITVAESSTTYDLGKYYVILPSSNQTTSDYTKRQEAQPVRKDFRYSSDTNPHFLSPKQLVDQLTEIKKKLKH